jgi:7,8-dihydropterin-6-yl-methyl-4-(beta-D-ribofuranosyl)aminobenzene 5'-phosphate synthase
MSNTIRVTVLVENTASGRNTRGEHGLAYWIETDTFRLLFDTGQTQQTLLHNTEQLKVDLAGADAVVLSHGHFDHTGGLPGLLQQMDRPSLYLHPAALARRFSRHHDGAVVDVGIPIQLDEAALRQHAVSLDWTERPVQISDAIWATGPVPRVNDYEDTGGDFYLDRDCKQIDPITDDQAIFFPSRDGTVVVVGCAHAGVINTLQYVRRLTNNKPIHAVIGGMHLVHASEERLERTGEALRQLDVQVLAPAHCTGPMPTAWLWAQFPERWRPCHVGSRFEYELSGE